MNGELCPYCRAALNDQQDELLVCPSCATPHHADCFKENGGCTVFGCASAPPPEPKLSIATVDLHAPPTASPLPPSPATPPPPPPAGSFGAPPPSLVPEFQPPPLFSSLGYGPPQFAYAPASIATPVVADSAIDPTLHARNRTTFLILGVLLGAFGAHSFYAGSIKKGFLQLAITIFTLGLAGFMVWVWAVIDVCTITKDNDGVPFRN